MKKPNVDLIEGLSPAIAIEQKNTSKNPRSTVATVTEIYDYMRVLFARAGIPYSPFTGKPITSQTITQIVDLVKNVVKDLSFTFFDNSSMLISSLSISATICCNSSSAASYVCFFAMSISFYDALLYVRAH